LSFGTWWLILRTRPLNQTITPLWIRPLLNSIAFPATTTCYHLRSLVKMAEFVRAQIFGTTFEITSRYSDLQPVGMGAFGLVWSVLLLLLAASSSI
jgi:hypothetical protein